MKQKVIDIFIVFFFLLSLVYLVKNLFFSPYSFNKIETYRSNIKELEKLIEMEEKKRKRLLRIYSLIENERNETLKAFIRDFLFLTEPDTQIYLKGQIKNPQSAP